MAGGPCTLSGMLQAYEGYKHRQLHRTYKHEMECLFVERTPILTLISKRRINGMQNTRQQTNLTVSVTSYVKGTIPGMPQKPYVVPLVGAWATSGVQCFGSLKETFQCCLFDCPTPALPYPSRGAGASLTISAYLMERP